MKEYTRFDDNGKITDYGLMLADAFDAYDSNGIIEGNYDDRIYYIVDNVPCVRPTLQLSKTTIIANGADESIASNLPIPFNVEIDNSSYEINDGEFIFSTNVPGKYIIKVNTFPYSEDFIIIEAI